MKVATVQKSKITLRDVWTVFWRWQLSCEMSNSYERMQSVAYLLRHGPGAEEAVSQPGGVY